MSDDDWYYLRSGQQVGPVDVAQLRDLFGSGQLRPADLVWTEGLQSWVPAQHVPRLFHAQPAQEMPPPLEFASQPGAGGMLGYYTPAREQVPYAGFWMRFGAHLLDQIILAAVQYSTLFAAVRIAAAADASDTVQAALQGLNSLAFMMIGWLYYAFMESSSRQATLGEMALGIIVVDYAGQRLTFGRASGRHFGKILSGLICGIGFMMAGWTARKQALHDQLASTLVVRKAR